MVGILFVATSAFAYDDAEGAACTTSDECGGLKCIDERCRDVDAVARGEAPSSFGTLGNRAMFGHGEGYGAVVAALDIAATAVEPLLMLAATSNSGEASTLFGITCFIPVGLAGSTVHAVYRRAIPAVISFFAWTSLAATTFVVGGLFGLAFASSGELNSAAAWTSGIAFGAGGAALLTWLDVWMARRTVPSGQSTTSLRLVPTLAPIQGGGVAGVAGSW